jgi:nifR3 family TIM-barrel protein
MRIGTLELPGDLFVAPLAGISNPPFRVMAYRHGADLAFTEMVAVEGLARRIKACRALLSRAPGERHLAVQLFGKDPARFAEAAKVAEGEGADLIDINLGCPARKVVGSGSGSALMRDPAKAGAIVAAVRGAVAVPVTAKIRAGYEKRVEGWREVASALVDAGVDAITLHPRFREQMFAGSADWSLIAALVSHVRVPVIGNGDVRTPEDYRRMKEETGCAGVMIGRGFIGHPWLLAAIKADAAGRSFPEPGRAEVLDELLFHLRMEVDHIGSHGVAAFRKHLVRYTKSWPGISHLRPILMQATTVEEVERILRPLTLEVG